MKLIDKWWKRLIIGLISAGMIEEVLHIVSDGKMSFNSFIVGMVIYLLLSFVYGISIRKNLK